MPSEPASTAASSLSMSPKVFSITITSKSRGRVISVIAVESTSACSVPISGLLGGDLGRQRRARVARSRGTLALSTLVTFLRRAAANVVAEAHESRDLLLRDTLQRIDALVVRRESAQLLGWLAEVQPTG